MNLWGQHAGRHVRHAARRHEDDVNFCGNNRKWALYMKLCGEEGGGACCMPCACMCIACMYLTNKVNKMSKIGCRGLRVVLGSNGCGVLLHSRV
jgi:hypothetical protein